MDAALKRFVSEVMEKDIAVEEAFPATDADRRTVADIMKHPVVRIHHRADLEEAIDLFRKHRIRRLIVTDGPLVQGLLSPWDVLDALAQELRARTRFL